MKVRYFNGALLEDMFHKSVPLMRKKPFVLILHVVTNNIVSDSSKVILKKINLLIFYIKINNPKCRIIISQPVGRTDNGKVMLTLNNLNKLLAELDVDKIDNRNIDVPCLAKHRLHLNNTGTGKLALNSIKFLKACFKENNTRICKFKSTSQFFQHAFDINSGIHSPQQRVREPDDLKLNSSDRKRRNKEQVLIITKIILIQITLMGSLKLVLSQIVLTIILKTLKIVQ